MKLILFILPLVSGQGIARALLDCTRLHPSFCCTSRIRQMCAEQCASVPCGPEHYQQMFSIDQEAGRRTGARDGDIRHISNRDETPPPLPPPPPAASSSSVTGPAPRLSNSITPSPAFPTLIPFEPNIDAIPQEKEVFYTTTTTKRRTSDPRIITPPETSLVLIGDYEEGDVSPTTVPTATMVTLPKSSITKEEIPDVDVSQAGGSFVRRSIPANNFQGKDSNWGVAVQKSFIEKTPSGAVDGSARITNTGSATVQRVVQPFINTPPPSIPQRSAPWPEGISPNEFLPLRGQQPPFQSRIPPQPQFRQTFIQPTPVPFQPTPPPQPQPIPPFMPNPSFVPAPIQPTIPPRPAPGTCGVAPHFLPCISAQEASLKLLACCQQKGLPPGCLALCRYDITQAEVRAAFDRGQCSLFNVSPFLECAAQGKDNSQCCNARGVAQKSGPQCLQFCAPSKGLTPLGLQHVSCGNAIGEMLQCHHSGLTS